MKIANGVSQRKSHSSSHSKDNVILLERRTRRPLADNRILTSSMVAYPRHINLKKYSLKQAFMCCLAMD